MKIGIISDIHIDINKDYPILDELINQINEKQLDVVLIAGDISEKVTLSLEAIEDLNEKTNATVYFVPGNHDMWGKDYPSHSTDKIYEAYKESPYCICEKSILLTDNIKLIGNVGWYDYSFGEAKYSFKEFEEMKHDERTWQDKLFNDWTRDNSATSKWQLDLLTKAQNMTPASFNILMTHMVSHTRFTVPLDWSKSIDWGYFNAFLGSKALYDFCIEKKIDMAIMGHVHYRGVFKDNNTLYICSCLNYYNEWQSKDYKKEIAEALYIIEK